jgi:hypothetical protein
MSLDKFGNYASDVPKDLVENVWWRTALYEELGRGDGKFVRGIWELCRQDFLFYINAFGWQFNPNAPLGDEVGPFVTWDFQDEAAYKILDSIEGQRDLVIEKSRDMGASWLCLFAFEWMWHFYPFQKFLCVSRSEKLVDSADSDSLFWKLDFIHRYQPDCMKPEMKRTKLAFENVNNSSMITGEATTGKIGVGGRARAMLIDEFSQIREDRKVLDRTSDTSKCRIFNGTHVGTGTAFYQLTIGGMPKLQMHWTQHPVKRQGLYRFDQQANRVQQLDEGYRYDPDYNYVIDGTPKGGLHPGVRSPWYDGECKRKSGPRAVAMDLDVDPEGSVSQFFDPLIVRKLAEEYAEEPYWVGDLQYDFDTATAVKLVEKPDGPLQLWIHPIPGENLRMPPDKYALGADCATGSGATPTCASCINSRGEKVLQYANPHISGERFARLAIALCRIFTTHTGESARFAWEHNGPGLLVTKAVIELGLTNVIMQGDEFDFANRTTTKPGWCPTPSRKNLLMEEYRTALYTRQFMNRSREAILECLRFYYNGQGFVEHANEVTGNSDPAGARVNHGDRATADALAWKMAREFVRLKTIEEKPTQTDYSMRTLAGRRLFHEKTLKDSEDGAWGS